MSLRTCSKAIDEIAETLASRSKARLSGGYPSGDAIVKIEDLKDNPTAIWLMSNDGFPLHEARRNALIKALKRRIGAPRRRWPLRKLIGDRWEILFFTDSIRLIRR